MKRFVRGFVLGLLIILSTIGGASLFVPKIEASSTDAERSALGVGEEVEGCQPWRKAGSVLIYRCEDWSSGDTCFVHQLGMMFCVRE